MGVGVPIQDRAAISRVQGTTGSSRAADNYAIGYWPRRAEPPPEVRTGVVVLKPDNLGNLRQKSLDAGVIGLDDRRYDVAAAAARWTRIAEEGRDNHQRRGKRAVESVRAMTVSVGLVGLGYWGPNLLRVLSGMAGVRVRWMCDLDRDRLGHFERLYPSIKATANCEDLLRDPRLDAVLIATPVFTHFDLASRSLAARKHTFVEKPLAASSEEADELLGLADADGLVLMCGHTFIYSPPVRAVKALLEGGELGEVFFISSSRVNLGLHQPDVSVIWDLGPHDFSILRYWLEEMPSSVSAVGRDSIVEGIPDVAFVTLRFPSGTLANVEISWLAPSKLRRTVVVGSKKMVVYDDSSTEPVRIFDHGVVHEEPTTFGEYQLSYRTGDIVSPHLDSAEPLAVELADFVNAVDTETPPPGHGEMCRDVVRLIEAAEESLQDDGAPVSIDTGRFSPSWS
jgi:predicted dehydrogenase